MTLSLTTSVFGILSWLKEHQSVDYSSLDAVAAPFGLNRDQMQRNLRWLQRYECVKRGGRANAEWSITQQGLVRLAEGRFSHGGAFLSAYAHAEEVAVSSPDPAPESTVTVVPKTADRRMLDLWAAALES